MLVVAATFGCGSGEADKPVAAPDGHTRMLRMLEEVRRRTPTENPYLGEAQLRQFEEVFASMPADAPALRRFHVKWAIDQQLLRLGRLAEAIAGFESAYDLLSEIGPQLSAEARQHFLLNRATAYLRLGETQNCVHCTTGESCILPLEGGGIHVERMGIEKARECLSELLKEYPNDLTAQWLLNIACMAAGEYPDGVPEPFRVSPEKFRSQVGFPRFVNIAANLGVDEVNLCGGTAVEDFDNDGYLDLFMSTWDTAGEPTLFRNRGDGTFEPRVEEAGLAGLYGGLNVIHADYDNDEDIDLLVLRGGWLGETCRYPNSLLQNDGTGRFRDVTFESGLGTVHYPTQTAAWADFDNDGDLDLYIGNERYPSQLFVNDGRGHFADVAAAARVQNGRFAKGTSWGDYDGDGFADLYVSNYEGDNRLYHNNRDGTFTDVAPQLGVTGPYKSFPCWFWDYNNDGNLDLFVASYAADVRDVAAQFLDAPQDTEPACLYEGDGKGEFQEASALRRLEGIADVMGSNFGDLDNDGWLDMYLGTGYPEYEALMPNLMYRNAAGERFDDVTMAGGFGHLQKGHGVAFADLDNDGDQDIPVQMGGAYPGDEFGNVLFENPGFQNHWIGIKLIGTKSNRSAIGARIRVDAVEQGTVRSYYKWVNSGGSFGANPLQQQIGLGTADSIAKIEILWPRTGQAQVLKDVKADQFVEITEGSEGYRIRPLVALKFATDRATETADLSTSNPALSTSVP
jgi:hypothetical protein